MHLSIDTTAQSHMHLEENPIAPAFYAESSSNNQRIVLAIGRWMPIHKGHKQFLVQLTRQFDRLVIGIGSCYENGAARNCIPAVEREILLRRIFRHEGIPDEKITILPISDKETFEEWINDVIEICEQYKVTHFCTGNKEDILDVLEKKQIHLGLEIIDPEENSTISYHATDVRNAILDEDMPALADMLPEEVMDMVISQLKREIVAANYGQGRAFIPGKQTADILLLTQDVHGDAYILLGNRHAWKRDFAGYPALPGGGIQEYESAIDAALRILHIETGLHITSLDRAAMPMPVQIDNALCHPAEMQFVNIYSSEDTAINGTLGGASQCFVITTTCDRAQLETCLYSQHDLENLRFIPLTDLPEMELAYEQKNMIYEALDRLAIPCPEECFDVLREDGSLIGKQVTRRQAHQRGTLHGASHVCIYRRRNGGVEILLQKRSANKDSFPNAYDLASAGHVESGSTFRETAHKELSEELGITVDDAALCALCQVRISGIHMFHNTRFHNEELCQVYAVELDIDPSELILQESEVSEATWFPLSHVLEHIEAGDPLFCTDRAEFIQIAQALKKD